MTAGLPNQPELTEQSSPSKACEQQRAKIDALAEDFVSLLRAGQRPAIDDYVQQHPELADEIQDLFPTLEMLERCAPGEGDQPPSLFPLGDEAPRSLGEYRIIREVGRGGMGVVYEAEHSTMRRRVALKVLAKAAMSSGSFLERFHREARAAGRLHHTNIVPVFEVGSDDGLHFYTMQFIQGQNLDVVLDELRRLKRRREQWPEENTAKHAGPPTVQERLSRTIARNFLSGEYDKARPFLTELLQWRDATQPMGDLPREQQPPNNDLQTTAEQPATQTRNASPEAKENGDSLRPTVDEHPSSKPSLDDSSNSTAILRGLPHAATMGDASETYYQRVARVGLQAAEALEYAHGQGILHRDIKPSNLILDSAGVVWITDFGLAKDDDDNFTHSGDIVGTLRYMAPERFQGLSDTRSDIYGLGLSLYELGTLRYAYDATDKAALIQVIRDQEPRKPRQFDPNIPRDLETVILKAIHKSPAHRYGSATEMAEDLRAFLASRPIQARRISTLERTWLWCRRNPLQAVLMSCVAVLVAILFVGAIVFGILSNQNAERLANETARAQGAESRAVISYEQAQRRLYQSYFDRAQAGRWSGRSGQHFKSLESLALAQDLLPNFQLDPEQLEAERLKLRNEAIAALPLVDLHPSKVWPVKPGQTGGIALDAKYERIAQSSSTGDITIRRVSDDQVLATLPGPGERVWTMEFSPDGKYLYSKHHLSAPFSSPIRARVWHLPSQSLVVSLISGLNSAWMSFSPDSKQIAIGRSSRRIDVFSLSNGEITGSIEVASSRMRQEFHPDPKQSKLAVAFENVVQIWDVSQWPAQLKTEWETESPISTCNWEPDGSHVIIGQSDGTLQTWNVRQDPPTADVKFVGHTARVVRSRFTNGGDLVISDSWDGTSRFWDGETGEHLLRLDGMDFPVGYFSEDDTKLAYSNAVEIGFLEIANNFAWRQLRDQERCTYHHLSFHPRHPWLLASATEHDVSFWDLRTARRLEYLSWEDRMYCRFSPSGDELYLADHSGIDRMTFAYDEETQDVSLGFAERISDLPKGEVVFLADGSMRYVAQNDYRTMQIQNPATSEDVVLATHANMDFYGITPDGQLVATSTWQGIAIKLWNAATGEFLKELVPKETTACVEISSDGKYMVASTGVRQYLWRVGDWENPMSWDRAHPDGWPGQPAFSPDNQLVAMNYSRFELGLRDTTTGELLAVLQAPLRESISSCAFSPDGQFLAISGEHSVQIWDLDKVRKNLRNIGLDWKSNAKQKQAVSDLAPLVR